MQDEGTTRRGYCQCGCGHRTNPAPYTLAKNGNIRGEPQRFIHGHNGRVSIHTLYVVEDRGHETPCWIWQGGQTGNGYGRTKYAGRMRPATHAFWMDAGNGPVPDGLQLDHLCFVPLCVNPAHVEPVTPEENNRRKRDRKLTEADVAEIRAMAAIEEEARIARGRSRRRRGWQDDVARRYGITRDYVKQITKGERRVRG